MRNTLHLTRTNVTVRGSGLAALVNDLTVTTLSAAAIDGHVTLQTGQCRTFFERSGDGSIILPRNLRDRAYEVLRSDGRTVEVQGDIHWSNLHLADTAWAGRRGLPAEQRELAAKLIQFPFGQIVYHRGRDLRLFIATIIRLFADLSVLVVVMGRRHSAGLAGALTRLSSLRVYRNHGAAFAAKPSRLVVTRHFVPVINEWDWDVIVFADPACVLPKDCQRRIAGLRDHQLYCLRPAYLDLPKRDELELEGAVGPIIHTGPGIRGREATVEVQLATSPLVEGQIRLGAHSSALERKRVLYWHHDCRNRAIASIAVAASTLDLRTLWEHGLFLAYDDQWLCGCFGPRLTVAVLVEAPEHARELSKLLTGWTVLTADLPRQNPLLDRCIITELYASQHEVDADIVLVASGNACAGASVRFPRCLEDDEDTALQLLIDLADDVPGDFHERLRTYHRHGYSVH